MVGELLLMMTCCSVDSWCVGEMSASNVELTEIGVATPRRGPSVSAMWTLNSRAHRQIVSHLHRMGYLSHTADTT